MRENDLARGVVAQAVRDWISAMRPIRAGKKQTLEAAIRMRGRQFDELRRFFRSRWCAALIDDAMDTPGGTETAARILDALEKRYVRSKAAAQIRLYKEQGIAVGPKKTPTRRQPCGAQTKLPKSIIPRTI